MPGGDSILMTLAPQSASCRTQVGPARTRVTSSTVKRARAFEPRGNGIANSPRNCIQQDKNTAAAGRTSPILMVLSTGLGVCAICAGGSAKVTHGLLNGWVAI